MHGIHTYLAPCTQNIVEKTLVNAAAPAGERIFPSICVGSSHPLVRIAGLKVLVKLLGYRVEVLGALCKVSLQLRAHRLHPDCVELCGCVLNFKPACSKIRNGSDQARLSDPGRLRE